MEQNIDFTKIRLVVFDCDGVIINSASDISDAVNETLRHFDLPTVSEKMLITFVGDGAKNLIIRSINFSLKDKNKSELENALLQTDKILLWYLNYYQAHAVNKTILYPGFLEMIKSLSVHKIKTGIVTNKPSETLKTILNHFEINQFFDIPLGSDDLEFLKPNPDGLKKALHFVNSKCLCGKKNILPSEVLMVGDSATDIECAKNFGSFSCGITGGIGNTEKLLKANASINIFYASELLKYFGF